MRSDIKVLKSPSSNEKKDITSTEPSKAVKG